MKERRFLLALFALALLLRLAYLAEIRDNPFFDHPILDEEIHFQWAARLAEGEPWMPGEPFFRAPLYPYFLSVLFRIVGVGFGAPRVLQSLVTSLNPVFLYLIGRRLFSRTGAATAAVALAAYGMLLYFDACFLLESLFLPLLLVSILLLLRAAEAGPRRFPWIASGIALGLAAITRPNILLFLLVLPFWVVRILRGRGAANAVLSLAVGAAVPIAPVFLHNLAAGEPVAIAWQDGINLYIGNNAESDGMTAIAPGTEGTWWGGYRDMIRIAEREEGRALSRREISSYWREKAFDFFRRSPGRAAALFGKKVYLLLNDFEVSNNEGIYFFRRYSRIFSALLSFGFGLLFPLAAAGAVLIRWDRKSALLAIFLGSYALSIVLFFVTARYRIPLVPVLMLPAGIALASWARWRREAFGRRRALSLAAFAAALLLSNSNVCRLDRGDDAQGYYNVGVVHLTARRFDEAVPCFRTAIEKKPGYANARYDLALCYSYLDKLPEAREGFEALLEEHPENPEAHRALASVLERQGERERAIDELGEAIRLAPDHADALAARASLLREMGRLREAGEDEKRAEDARARARRWP